MLLDAMGDGLVKAASTLWTVAYILVPLFVVLQFIRELGWLQRISVLLQPVLRPLGLPREAAVPLATFLVFGMSIGAALLMDERGRHSLERRQVTVLGTLTSVAHALPDEAIVFVPLGANVWVGATVRLALGLMAGWAAARLLPVVPVAPLTETTAARP